METLPLQCINFSDEVIGEVKKSSSDYMAEIPQDLKEELYSIFQHDFILFGYDPDVL